jgi:1-deoxy-D-xylulose-5-phosphate reductoisomerase
VAAFLDRRIRFTDIHQVNARTVEAMATRLGAVASIDDLIELDQRSRAHARGLVKELAA